MIAKLRLIGDEKLDKVGVPIASATVIPAGSLVSYESGLAVLLNAEAEDATFIGVAETASKAGETDPMTVIKRGIFEVGVVSAAYTIGAPLMYSASGLLAATANTIAWAHEDTGGVSVTTLNVLIDVPLLGALFTR